MMQGNNKMLWFIFLMSHLIFIGVSYVVPPSGSEADPNIPYMLCAIGVAQFAGCIWLPSILKNNPNTNVKIIQYALLDACSILGFVTFFLANDRTIQGLLATLGIVGMLWLYPKEQVRGRPPAQ